LLFIKKKAACGGGLGGGFRSGGGDSWAEGEAPPLLIPAGKAAIVAARCRRLRESFPTTPKLSRSGDGKVLNHAVVVRVKNLRVFSLAVGPITTMANGEGALAVAWVR